MVKVKKPRLPPDFRQQRYDLVDSLIRRGHLKSDAAIQAMRSTPREFFVPEDMRSASYVDRPLEIGEGQTISAPHMVAIMAEALDLKPGHKVLEIGAGSGYHAAVVANMIGPEGHVYTVERIHNLAQTATFNIRAAGMNERVSVIEGDGSKGLPEHAPYDRIFVAAASPNIPRPLEKQLKEGGKILVPVGKFHQDLLLGILNNGRLDIQDLGGCIFVPLLGEYGF
jgi:protein-L-isoaspartate(D-aspartate) O-methyltransferase